MRVSALLPGAFSAATPADNRNYFPVAAELTASPGGGYSGSEKGSYSSCGATPVTDTVTVHLARCQGGSPPAAGGSPGREMWWAPLRTPASARATARRGAGRTPSPGADDLAPRCLPTVTRQSEAP
jgi:hypothetical protein